MLFLDLKFPERTNEDYKYGYSIGTDKDPYFGVKSKVKIGMHLNLPNALILDYMHLILLGLFKSMSKLFFNSSNNRKSYYIGK